MVSLKLGLTSFGGPVAHIGYFRDAYVERLKWLTEERFAELMAMTQFLPGPASSQLGANATVVGVLGAALLGMLTGGSVAGLVDFAAVIVLALAINFKWLPVWALVVLAAVVGGYFAA